MNWLSASPGPDSTYGPELIETFRIAQGRHFWTSRVAALWHPAAYEKRTMEGMLRETETAAQALSSAATSIIAALCRAQARRISRAANGFRKLKA